MNIIKKKKTGIGLDIGNKEIKLVVLERKGSDIEIRLKAVIPNIDMKIENGELIDVEPFCSKLSELLTDNKVSDKRIVLSLSSGIEDELAKKNYVVRTFAQQVLPTNEMKKSIKYNIEKEMPISEDEYYLSYAQADTYEQNGKELCIIFAVATRKKLMDSFIQTLKKIKVMPYCMEMGILAEGRSLIDLKNREEGNTNCIILDLGYAESQLLIINNGSPYYYRSIEIGVFNIIQNISTELNIPFEEAEEMFKKNARTLTSDEIEFAIEHSEEPANIIVTRNLTEIISEVKEIMDFVQRKGVAEKIDAIYLDGGGSNIIGIDAFFEQHINIPTKSIIPYFDKKKLMDNSDKKFNRAIGLALKGVEE